MTLREWNNLDKRELSQKAMEIVAVTDPSIYDYVKKLDINDLDSINKALENFADAVNNI